MTLASDIRDSASSLRDVSAGLASALRLAAGRPSVTSTVRDTFQEAEALSLTVDAVCDVAAPLLALFEADARVVGRVQRLGRADAKICNGFDSLGHILLILLRRAADAVSDVAVNQSQWVVSPLQAKQCQEAMVIHHGQLRAMYGLCHLASMVIGEIDVERTLFLDVTGDTPRPELEPQKWRAAIDTEPLFGRFFGFHYQFEMRNFLLGASIARGSIATAAATTPEKSSPMVRNLAALGWGWIFSSMTIANQIVNIPRASQIGMDDVNSKHTIEHVRAFMNLSEDPFVTGVAALASVDVAVNFEFEIRPEPCEESASVLSANPPPEIPSQLHTIPRPPGPIPARLISHPKRPIVFNALRRRKGETAASSSRAQSQTPDAAAPQTPGIVAPPQTPDMGVESVLDSDSVVPPPMEDMPPPVAGGPATKSAKPGVGSERGAVVPANRGIGDGIGGAARNLSARFSGVTDSSVLASTIKAELDKLQSNVASLWEPTRYEPASTLIVHFHGGGFVSQSSHGHAIYLREWAADIPDAVIVSIDYRLSPENPYPAALDDCLYSYQWILENRHTLGTDAKRVVVVGDSAGGNLAVAVALKARLHGLRAPDGVCLAYPALYVNVAWSPSRLLSFFDPLLPLSILDLCLRSYIPEGEKGYANPEISPMIATPDALRGLPPVSIVCGSWDPLLDDSVQFMHNLVGQGRDCDDFEILESLPHGFLNMVHVNGATRDACHSLARRIARLLQVPFPPPKRRDVSDPVGGKDGSPGNGNGNDGTGGENAPSMPMAAFYT